MTTGRIPLVSGHIQHDHLCKWCGYHEREVRTVAGKLLHWRNVTLQRRLAAAKQASV